GGEHLPVPRAPIQRLAGRLLWGLRAGTFAAATDANPAESDTGHQHHHHPVQQRNLLRACPCSIVAIAMPPAELFVQAAAISHSDDELAGTPAGAASAEPCASSLRIPAAAVIRVAKPSGMPCTISSVCPGVRFVSARSMADSLDAATTQGGLSDDQKRENVVRLVFGGRAEHLESFCRAVDEVIPPGTI